MSLALLRAEVFSALENLAALCADLEEAIRVRDADLYVWVAEGGGVKEKRDLAARTLASLAFPVEEGGTHIVPGVLGASSKTIRLAREVNQAKRNLKAVIMDLREAEEGTGNQEIRFLLHEAGYERFSLRQGYREIIVLDELPERIAYTWMTQNKSVRKVTREEVEKYLVKTIKDAWRLSGALDAVRSLPKDAPLYVVRNIKPHVRANVFKHDGTHQHIMAHSPIMVPMEAEHLPPMHNKPPRPSLRMNDAGEWQAERLPDHMRGARLPRRDRIIASRPLIPGTPFYTTRELMNERL